jgi:hypothetical protein
MNKLIVCLISCTQGNYIYMLDGVESVGFRSANLIKNTGSETQSLK